MKVELEITDELGKGLKEIADRNKVEVNDVVKLALSHYVVTQTPKPKFGLSNINFTTVSTGLCLLADFLRKLDKIKD